MVIKMNRRQFISKGITKSASYGVTAYCLGFSISNVFASGTKRGVLPVVSASYKKTIRGMNYYISWFDNDREVNVSIPFRGHDVLLHPAKPDTILVIGRRPGIQFCEVSINKQAISQFVSSDSGLHFYGHACFSRDGQMIFTTENDFNNAKGRIVIRSSDNYKVISSFDSYGIGPHDIKLLTDSKTLVIANGGIETHPDQLRKKLNISTMKPNLSYIDSINGDLLAQYTLDNHQSSIRHLAVSKNDTVVAALQYQGEHIKPVPLVAIHERGDLMLKYPQLDEKNLSRMNYYTASAAFNLDGSIYAVTSPKGNLVTFWLTKEKRLISSIDLHKPYGVIFDNEQDAFIISTSKGELHAVNPETNQLSLLMTSNKSWDNHMISIKGAAFV